MRHTVDRGLVFSIASGLLMIAFMATIIILYSTVTSRTAEIDRLQQIIVDIQSSVDTRDGGAETDPPPTQAPGPSVYTFPIARTDFLQYTSAFGYRISPILRVERYHQGVDIAATWRAQVVAIADGIVVEHWPVPGTRHPSGALYRGHAVYGGMVMVEHEDGWKSLYAHLSESRVMTGSRVRAGQVIGRVGDTGQSRGAHLHFELIDDHDARVNPLIYVSPGPPSDS